MEHSALSCMSHSPTGTAFALMLPSQGFSVNAGAVLLAFVRSSPQGFPGCRGPIGTWTGEVMDEEAGTPFQGATVALGAETVSESTPVTGIITGPGHRFSLEDVPAESFPSLSVTGAYQPSLPDIRPLPDDTDLCTPPLDSDNHIGGELRGHRRAACRPD